MEMGLTIQETFSKPTIRTVFKGEYGSIGFSVVEVLVSRFADSFGFSNKLSAMQIETITVDTLENFAYESLHDIVLFFKMARSGKFGSTGRGIDSNLIFGDWYPKYLEQKAQLREDNYQKTKNERSANITSAEDVKKTYAKIAAKAKTKKVANYIDKISKTMDRQMLEDTIMDWEKDPDRKPYVAMLKKKRLEIK